MLVLHMLGRVGSQQSWSRLAQVHIVVATPGRVLDLANKGVAKLKDCHTFVMDEVTFAIAARKAVIFV